MLSQINVHVALFIIGHAHSFLIASRKNVYQASDDDPVVLKNFNDFPASTRANVVKSIADLASANMDFAFVFKASKKSFIDVWAGLNAELSGAADHATLVARILCCCLLLWGLVGECDWGRLVCT